MGIIKGTVDILNNLGSIFKYRCFFCFVEIAVCLLQKYEQNLQIAVNIYLENCSSCSEVSSISCMPMDVDDVQGIAQGPVVKTSSHCCNMESETSNCGK